MKRSLLNVCETYQDMCYASISAKCQVYIHAWASYEINSCHKRKVLLLYGGKKYIHSKIEDIKIFTYIIRTRTSRNHNFWTSIKFQTMFFSLITLIVVQLILQVLSSVKWRLKWLIVKLEIFWLSQMYTYIYIYHLFFFLWSYFFIYNKCIGIIY